MYVEIDFNLLYQVEKIATQTGRSVTELVNEAVAEYVEQHPAATGDSPASKPDDAS